MKIVAVLGSPRPQGNSGTLARTFLNTAKELGAETTEFLLNQMDFQGCQGCRGCKTKCHTCILKDDLTPVLRRQGRRRPGAGLPGLLRGPERPAEMLL